MRIKKTSQYIEGGAEISNVYGTSTSNGYSQNYINNLNTYSTNEVRIGNWDSKPLYRKIITGTMPTVQTEGTAVNVTVSLGSLNIKDYFLEWQNVEYGNRRFPINWIQGNLHVYANIDNNKDLSIESNMTAFNNRTFFVSLLYTKTTD